MSHGQQPLFRRLHSGLELGQRIIDLGSLAVGEGLVDLVLNGCPSVSHIAIGLGESFLLFGFFLHPFEQGCGAL